MNYKEAIQMGHSLQICYSLAFKKKVVEEVESGVITKYGAKKKYNIGGKSTVLNWCRKYGKEHRKGNGKMVSIKNKIKEKDKEKEKDKNRIRDLERALADAHLKLHAQDIMMDIAKKELGIDIKKKCGSKLHKK